MPWAYGLLSQAARSSVAASRTTPPATRARKRGFMGAVMLPAEEGVAAVDEQLHPGADRHRHLGGDVAERQAFQDRRLRHRADPVDRGAHRVAAVVGRLLPGGEGTEHDGALRV